MACNDCIEDPEEGCLQQINSECITYNGNDVECADISSGQILNQVIEQLGDNDCSIKEDIEDILQDIEDIQGDIEELSGNVNINLEELNNHLTDIDEHLVDIDEQLSAINSFSCEDLNSCSIDDLSDVDVSPLSGDVLMFDGEFWVQVNTSIITDPLQTQINLLDTLIDNLIIRVDACCPSGEPVDIVFESANLFMCSLPNTIPGKIRIYDLVFAPTGTGFLSVEGLILITLNVPGSPNPTKIIVPTPNPAASEEVYEEFFLLSGMKSELMAGGGGGTLEFTIQFTDLSSITRYAILTFDIPVLTFELEGDIEDCHVELFPSNIEIL